MGRDEAAEHLAAMVPGLDAFRLDWLLDLVEGRDEAGEPAWNVMSLYRAARDGCLEMCDATQFDFGTDGQTFSRSQSAQIWREKAEMYGRRLSGSSVLHTEQV